jgi:hypothetical protein
MISPNATHSEIHEKGFTGSESIGLAPVVFPAPCLGAHVMSHFSLNHNSHQEIFPKSWHTDRYGALRSHRIRSTGALQTLPSQFHNLRRLFQRSFSHMGGLTARIGDIDAGLNSTRKFD